jgi:hypothetical protein
MPPSDSGARLTARHLLALEPRSQEEAWFRAFLGYSLLPGSLPPPVPHGLDWEQVFHLACEHRLAGLLFTLGRSRPGLWPATFQDRLRSARYRTLMHGGWCNCQVQAILEALNQAGVPAIVLKGWARIPTIYGNDPGQRTYEDIDLLVLPEQVAEAEEALARLDYESSIAEHWPGYRLRYSSSWRYRSRLASQSRQTTRRHPAQFFSVGLHWGLMHHTFYRRRMPVQQFFDRALPLRVAGAEALRLAPEDDLVYTCGHQAVQHAYNEYLFRYYEVAALILHAGDALDWDVTLERAGAWRLVLSVQGVLRLVEGLWPGVVPPHRWQQVAAVKPTRFECWLHPLQSRHHYKSTLRVLLDWLATPGLARRAGFLLETAFPGQAYLRQRYGSPPGGVWPLLYFRRAAEAARRLCREQ